MLASELIKRLQAHVAEYGDHDVVVMGDQGEPEPVAGITCGGEEEGKVDEFMIADAETLIAFGGDVDETEGTEHDKAEWNGEVPEDVPGKDDED